MLKVRNYFLLILILGVIFVICYCYWNYQQEQINSLNEILETLKREIDSSSLNDKDYLTTKRDFLRLENTLRGSVFQLASSLFFVLTVVIAWLNFVVSDQKQVAERFATAVEQLGSEQLGVKVGGIFALEKVAETSPETHWQVIEVLTSYIRDQSFKGNSVSKPDFKEEDNQSQKSRYEQVQNQIAVEYYTSVTIDIQTALTVICRRDSRKDPKDKIINLRSCDIRGANLENAKLNNADLSGSKISGANLENAKLRGTNLERANLDRVVLSNSDLSKAKLKQTVLTNAKLEEAFLQEADLSHVNFQESNLKNANFNYSQLNLINFIDAHLEGTNFDNTELKWVNLKNASINSQTKLTPKWKMIHDINTNGAKYQMFDDKFDFKCAKLANAKFNGAILKSANFDSADLGGAIFNNAYLEGASFQKADIRPIFIDTASFSGAYLKKAVFKQVSMNCTHFETKELSFNNVIIKFFIDLFSRSQSMLTIILFLCNHQIIQKTDLTQVTFEEVNLNGADFKNAILIKAKFIRCILTNVNFQAADLREAKFDNCSWNYNVNFEEAFEEANIDQTEFKGPIDKRINFNQAKNYNTAKFYNN